MLLLAGSNMLPFLRDRGEAVNEDLRLLCRLGVSGIEATSCGLGSSKGPVGLFRPPFRVKSTPLPLPLLEVLVAMTSILGVMLGIL